MNSCGRRIRGLYSDPRLRDISDARIDAPQCLVDDVSLR